MESYIAQKGVAVIIGEKGRIVLRTKAQTIIRKMQHEKGRKVRNLRKVFLTC